MIPFVIPSPNIDPVLFELGPIAIRWHGLAYMAGLALGLWYRFGCWKISACGDRPARRPRGPRCTTCSYGSS